jgi:predicted Holliday junction resolvase-like endonuclease
LPEAERDRLARAEVRLFEETARLKERATQDGRKEMERRLQGLMGFFRAQQIALRDMKLLFHPVDYFVFRGLSPDRCTGIEFLDSEPSSAAHERLQCSIERTIKAGDYSWVTMRIEDDGRVSYA